MSKYVAMTTKELREEITLLTLFKNSLERCIDGADDQGFFGKPTDMLSSTDNELCIAQAELDKRTDWPNAVHITKLPA